MTANIHPDLVPLAMPLSKMRPMSGNARYHDSESVESIRRSLEAYGQRKPIVVRDDGEIIAGNGTYEAALELGWDSLAVVKVSEDRTESLAYSIADNRSGDLSEWATEALRAAMAELEGTDLYTGFSDADLEQMLADLEDEGGGEGGGSGGKEPEDTDPNYTRKVEVPVYEMKGERPDVSDLLDRSKEEELVSAIEAADIGSDLKSFLRAAAARHVVFDYEQIAEFYAHAEPAVQRLMEDSALVIVDFDRAIELGFVKLAGKLGEAYDADLAAKGAEEVPDVEDEE